MSATRVSLAILLCASLVNAQTTCSPGEGTACLHGDYCSESTASCVNGYCRCFGSQTLDPCTCLPTIGSCHIEVNASSHVGRATYRGSLQTPLYSCVANDNCNYDVHVISSYYARVRYRQITSASVYVNVLGQSSKPLIIVLLSYEPVSWSLSITSGVVIDTVIVGGFYVTRSRVSFSPGTVLAVEKPSRAVLPFAYGSESRNTIRVLQYVANRFGPLASFTGTEQATSWILNINRRSADLGCVSVTAPPTVSTPLFTTTVVPASCTEPESPQSTSSCSGGRQCVRNIFNYLICSGGQEDASCVNGYCRCYNSYVREPCNCYPRLGGCLVQEGLLNSVGTPSSYSGSYTPTTYSCVTNCTGGQYEVHVVGMYDAAAFQSSVNVQMTVCGRSSKRLVLVLISEQEVQWVVDVPSGVFIHRILVSSLYTDRTNVSHTPQRVGTVEKTGYGYLPYGYGRDISGGSTAESLQYLINRFGSIASFSGAYDAEKWVLNIHRENDSSSCTTSVTETTNPPTSVTETTDSPTRARTCFGFRCGSRCITHSQVCDGTQHCLDGSDELNCIDASMFPPFTSAPRTTGTGLSIGGIFGIVSGVLAVAFVLLMMGTAACIKFHSPSRGNTPVAPYAPARSQELEHSTQSYSSALQQQYTTTVVNSHATLGNGILHSTVPLESELQNVPPPAYSASHQYPVYSPDGENYEGKDDLHVQNENTSLSKEPTQEPPPPYPGLVVPESMK